MLICIFVIREVMNMYEKWKNDVIISMESAYYTYNRNNNKC